MRPPVFELLGRQLSFRLRQRESLTGLLFLFPPPLLQLPRSFRAQFGKPVIYDECKYEGDVPQGWGNLTPREMTQRFWLGTLGGCYVGHGETYLHPEDILWWSKGGALHGKSAGRIQWLKDFMAKAPPFHDLQPTGDDKTAVLISVKDQPGALYHLLLPFADAGISLTRIESRPSRQKAWEYVFFIDLLGHIQDPKVSAVLEKIREQSDALKVLGSFPRAELQE